MLVKESLAEKGHLSRDLNEVTSQVQVLDDVVKSL